MSEMTGCKILMKDMHTPLYWKKERKQKERPKSGVLFLFLMWKPPGSFASMHVCLDQKIEGHIFASGKREEVFSEQQINCITMFWIPIDSFFLASFKNMVNIISGVLNKYLSSSLYLLHFVNHG